MKRVFIAAIMAVIWLLGSVPCAHAQVKKVRVGQKKSAAKEASPGTVVNILADKLEQYREKNQLIGIGNVKIKHLEMRISADRVELNTDTGFGVAEGNVVIIDEENGHKIICSFLKFNINSKKATIYDSKGVVSSEFYFHGKKMERKSANHYVIHEGDITSCTGDNPVWQFRCAKLDAHTGDHAILRDASFLFKGRPIISLPWAYVPLNTERSTGFLIPQIGSSQQDGSFFNNAFFWAINEQWDATFGLDYLSKRGIRPSAELRYFTSPTTRGNFFTDFLHDRDSGQNYWKILFDHSQILPHGVQVVTNVEWLDGTNYDKIFSDSISERTRRETDNYLTITKNWENKSLFFEARYHKSLESLNSNESGTLPQIIFKNQLQRLGGSPLFFELDASYADFVNKPSSGSKVAFTHRADIHPQFSLPVTKWPWLTVTPKVGVRETIYDHGNLNAPDDFLTRTVYNFDMAVNGPSFTKTFLTRKGTAYKHLIEPRINYSYIPEIGSVRNKIVVSDGLDTINKKNIVSYALTNRLFKKAVAGDSFATREVIRFDVTQSYNFNIADNGPGSRPFSDLRFDFDSHPFDKVMFNFDSTFSVYDYRVNTANAELVLKIWDDFGMYLERRYIRNASTDVLGTFKWNFIENWDIKFTTRYDEKAEHFRENDLSVYYQAQCWGFGLDLIKRINFVEGQKVDDTRFLFQVSLKGLGGYGSKKEEPIHRRF